MVTKAIATAPGQTTDRRSLSTEEEQEVSTREAEFEAVAVARLVAHVEVVRDRKLAAGFDYDFGDSRGVHTFGTTPKDRRGWNEVKAIADAALQAGTPTQAIDIRTDTGGVTIEAQEWPAIQLASAQEFQPVWQASWPIKDAVRAGTVTTFDEVDDHAAWP